MLGKLRQFAGFVLPAVIRPLRVLWNEIIGFVFLSMTVLVSFSGFRKYRSMEGDSDAPFILVLTAGFAFLLLYFGLSSFWRARKISKS